MAIIGDGHDGEALADDQCDQGHVDDVRHIVDEVVQLGEEAVQLTDIAPDQADDDAEDALAHGNDEARRMDT